MRCQSVSRLRSAAARRAPLSLAKAISMGLRSGGVGRQEEQPGTGCLDRLARFEALVAGEVVEHQHVAWPQLGRQHLLDVGGEDDPVHRSVEDQRRDEAFGGQAGDEGCGLPVPVGRLARHPFPAPGPAVAPHHVGRSSGLVEEDQAAPGEQRLQPAPALARPRDISPPLLAGQHAFF